MKQALNNKKFYSTLVHCEECDTYFWTEAKRRFTRCIKCHNQSVSVPVNRQVQYILKGGTK